MKKVFLIFIVLMLASQVFAASSNTPKTLGYYIMPSTDFGNLNSGLLYEQKDDDKWGTQIIYTSYRSVYLLTNNVTQLTVQKKYKLLEFGMANLKGLFGAGLVYSPAVGGGATANVGGELNLVFSDAFFVRVPAYMLLYSDGFCMNLWPYLQIKPGIINKEFYLFGGAKMEAMMVGSFQSAQNSGSGKLNTYFTIGAGSAL